MKSLKLRAHTVVSPNKWYSFTLEDLPTPYTTDNLALSASAGSPLLSMQLIVRGDPESGLFEGDIIKYCDKEYVICYERGFYAISADYEKLYLYQLTNYEIVGDYWINKFPIEIQPRKKQLYHYKDISFKLTDIVGRWGNKLLIRSTNTPIEPSECQQECGIQYKHKKLFFGDIVDGEEVVLKGGRICIKKEQGYLDLDTGEYLNGYNS